MQRRFLVLGLVLALSACQNLGDIFGQASLGRADALTYQQTLLGGQNLDLSRVVIVRMFVNGTRVDATSLNPEVLAMEGEGDNRAATVLAFNAARDGLIFFSRDPESGQGFVKEASVEELAKKPVFEFPLVVGTTVTMAKFEIVDVVTRP
jgi:hypothetical protein